MTNARQLLPEIMADRFQGEVPAVFVYCGAVNANLNSRLWYDLYLMPLSSEKDIWRISKLLTKMGLEDRLARA